MTIGDYITPHIHKNGSRSDVTGPEVTIYGSYIYSHTHTCTCMSVHTHMAGVHTHSDWLIHACGWTHMVPTLIHTYLCVCINGHTLIHMSLNK